MLVVEYDNESYYEASFNDLYDILKNDESKSEDVINAMESLNNQLKRSNANKMSQMIALFEQENLSLSEVKKKNDFRNSQNENTKATFVERYLFLIIKILFFVVFFCFFLYTLKDSFVDSATLPPNKNSI
tara:strand:- start:106 stop:495 length:390 start_codon:yes stop_codon:yes gene_type:complete